MSKLQFKRGLKANLPTLSVGEPGYTTDTKELYVGNASGGNTLLGVAEAWGGSTTLQRSTVWATRQTTNQTIPQTAWTSLVMNNELVDYLNEYNPSTGIFTAQKTGWYLIHARATMLNVPVNTFIYLRAFQNNAIENRIDSFVNTYTSATECGVGGSVTLLLNAGDTVRADIYSSLAVSVEMGAAGTRLEIIRLS